MRHLEEAKFTDKTPLGEVLEKYRGKGLWIHFSKPNRANYNREDGLPELKTRSPEAPPKLGINPKKHHEDPHGIYFYPIDWLLSHEKFLKGEQWATNWPNYFIADIDLSGNGINLSTITEKEISELAARNGWLDDWQHEIEANRNGFRSEREPREVMWMTLKTLNQRRDASRKSWLSSLRGVEYVLDRSGTIMAFEPEQICVMNPRIITIVERGTQPELEERNSENFEHWRYMVVRLFKDLVKQHGGDIVWRDKKPQWHCARDSWSIEISWNSSYSNMGLYIVMRNGEVSDSAQVSPRDLAAKDYSETLDQLSELVTYTQEMRVGDFNPIIDPEEGKAVLRKVLTWSNSKPVLDIRAKTSSYSLEVTKVRGRIPVTTCVRLSADEESYTIRVEMKINDNYVMYGSGDNVEELWANLHSMFQRKLNEWQEGHYMTGRLDDEYAEAFVGYLFNCSGLAFLEEYEKDFYETNSAELYRQIESIFRRIGW